MGYEARYNDDNDHVVISHDGQVIRDDHVLAYNCVKKDKRNFEEMYPGKKFAPNPKDALWFPTPKYGHIELRGGRFLKTNFNNVFQPEICPDLLVNHCVNSTAKNLASTLKKAKKGFSQTEECQFLTAQLENIKKRVHINNVILIGPGPMDEFVRESRKSKINKLLKITFISGVLQLAAALKICEVLGEPGNPLPLIAQEHQYSEFEKDFLKTRLNVKTVDDPDAFTLINNQSLVFYTNIGPHIDYFVSKGEWPAALLTNERSLLLKYPDVSGGFAQEITDHIYRMFDCYEKLPIGGEEKSKQFFGKLEEGDDPKYKRFRPWTNDVFLWAKNVDSKAGAQGSE
ncbi:hypothetical protein HYALB_00000851 [Hymenoscyphus albidus]|uniref:SRR1-like domain-containing protein n=1 Tax=Hymenoscyphus albidus TaxID=595503 RepID=A0A9N9LDV6_9HELO|nr:hypothetical protein HYALB_00000851 [Hymenoscyphus albidus]